MAEPSKIQGDGPSRQGIGLPLDVEQIGGAREEEASGPAIAIDARFDREEELRVALHLVNDEGAFGELLDECARISLGRRPSTLVIQGHREMGDVADESAGERALPDLPGAGDLGENM